MKSHSYLEYIGCFSQMEPEIINLHDVWGGQMTPGGCTWNPGQDVHRKKWHITLTLALCYIDLKQVSFMLDRFY